MSFLDRNADTPDRLRRNMQRLRNGAATASLKVTAPLVAGTSITLSLSTTGGLQVSAGALAAKLDGAGGLSTGTNGIAIANGSITAARMAILTTKGDLLGFDTGHNRIPAGINGQVLTADSTQTLGLKWATPAAAVLTTKGDLFTFDTANQRLAVGSNGQVLVPDSSQATGLRWQAMAQFKNRIVNGNFDFWQRGTSWTGPSQYTADRWFWNAAGGAASANMAQYVMALAEVGGNAPAKYGISYNATANPVTAPIIEQRIEYVATLGGQQATLSFWAKGTAGQVITVVLSQNFGTGGVPSATVNTTAGTATLTASWQKFTLTVAVPSVSAKTLGTGGNDYLGLQFQLGTGATYSVNLAQVQLEPGFVATDFEYRQPVAELLLCQRFYERSYAISQATGVASSLGPAVLPNSFNAVAASTAGNLGNGSFLGFKVEKRAAPAVVFYDFNGTKNAVWLNNATGSVNNTRGGATAGPVNAAGALQYVALDNTGTLAAGTASCVFAHWTADAEL